MMESIREGQCCGKRSAYDSERAKRYKACGRSRRRTAAETHAGQRTGNPAPSLGHCPNVSLSPDLGAATLDAGRGFSRENTMQVRSARTWLAAAATALVFSTVVYPATQTATFRVSATVQSECTIGATNLAFGTVGIITTNIDALSTITV